MGLGLGTTLTTAWLLAVFADVQQGRETQGTRGGETATAVHNEWWRGWGIRHVPRGWMYNIAGRDSVELELQSGNVFRIGTDDPDGLLAALRSASVTTPD